MNFFLAFLTFLWYSISMNVYCKKETGQWQAPKKNSTPQRKRNWWKNALHATRRTDWRAPAWRHWRRRADARRETSTCILTIWTIWSCSPPPIAWRRWRMNLWRRRRPTPRTLPAFCRRFRTGLQRSTVKNTAWCTRCIRTRSISSRAKNFLKG